MHLHELNTNTTSNPLKYKKRKMFLNSHIKLNYELKEVLNNPLQ